MSDSLRHHELQHARPPCPSPSPRSCSNSCPSSWWWHDAIQLSHPLSSPSPALNLSQHRGLFQWVGSSHQPAKVLELQSFQWILRVDFLEDWLVLSPCCPRDTQESFPAPQFESINSLALSLLYAQLSHPYMTTGKSFDYTDFCRQSDIPAF